MNWQAVQAVAELISAIGVVITLVYLAYQIRQNTQQLAQNERVSIASAVNAATTSQRENRRLIYTNAEVTEIFMKGQADPASLGTAERYRFRLLLHDLADTLFSFYLQTVVTGFAPEAWETEGIKLVERVLTTNGGRWFWENYGEGYTQDFRAEIDRIIASRAGAS